MLHMPCKKCTKESYTYATKELPHTQLKRSNTHQAPPANEWKLLNLGVWLKYRLVGHVWVHGSKLSFLSLCCLSENDTSLPCAWFWNGALGSLQRLWHWCYDIEVGHGILLTKVTHGVWNPKKLRATTSSGNVLGLGSGLCNTRLFAGRPRNQRGTQKLASSRSGLPIQPTPGKSASEKPWSAREEDAEYQRTKSGVWRKYLKIRFTACQCEVLEDAWKRAHRHTEN
jgi:hypothetical protein